MPKICPEQVIKEFRQRVIYSSTDIEALLKQHTMETLNLPAVSVKIIFEDETEGSPPYKVGVKAIVDVTAPLK